ncbi:MAG: Rieske (2Fe-2S) protein [Methanobacteriaceae archaeon]|nr:Rieske (2Fe-2S) protein [Methanobacteriaceae archaeon]
MNFAEIATVDDLENGEMKMFNIQGKEILLARAGNEYFATDNKCPHMGGDLSHGVLEGVVVTCPMHHSQFDLSNGEVIRWTDFSGIKSSLSKIFKSPRSLNTYPVKVEGDRIMVSLD